MTDTKITRIAVLDDYQGVAKDLADWGSIGPHSEIVFFRDHEPDENALAARLSGFDVVCVMRERTWLPGSVLERLPRLKLIASTGAVNRAIDAAAAERLGITVANTGYESTPTIEMTWALILGLARHVATENASLRAGGWQRTLGFGLHGKTLAVLGLGRIGSEVARIGKAFGMEVIAWSQNLTAERAAEAGVRLVAKEALFAEADVLTVHLILSKRTKGIVGAAELAMMKPGAWFVNTSRSQLVDQQALIERLRAGQLAGAGIDVFDVEPLPADHPYRQLPNVLATPHIGYVAENLYRTFYGDTVKNIKAWLAGRDAAEAVHGSGV